MQCNMEFGCKLGICCMIEESRGKPWSSWPFTSYWMFNMSLTSQKTGCGYACECQTSVCGVNEEKSHSNHVKRGPHSYVITDIPRTVRPHSHPSLGTRPEGICKLSPRLNWVACLLPHRTIRRAWHSARRWGLASPIYSPYISLFFWRYSPNLGLGLPPWISPFRFGLLDLRHSVRLLWRVISSSQGISTCIQTQKNEHTQRTLNIRAFLTGIHHIYSFKIENTYDASVSGYIAQIFTPWGFSARGAS
jgi:hypothetical protein